MNLEKIRLGVIGTGLAWEQLHYPAIQELNDKYEIVALANRTKNDAENFANKINLDLKNVYDDYNELLKRDAIDAVDILVPIQLNFEVAEAAINAKKHIICEKPMAPDMKQAEKFLKLSKNYDKLIMIAENYRYNEEYKIIRDILKSGKIGNPVYFIMNNVSCFPCGMSGNSYAGTEWRQHPLFPGGAFLDAALHDVAAMRYIFGNVDCLQAFGKPQNEDFNPYLSVSANILFENDVIGLYTYYPSGIETQKPAVGFRIFGTKGEIFLENKEIGTIEVTYHDGMGQNIKNEKIAYTPGRGYYNELLNFYNAFKGKEQILVTPEVEFGDVKMIFDILDSVSNKQLKFIDDEQLNPFAGIGNANEGYTQDYLQ